ncbi:meprin A subunit beta-like [Callorhinchus milii]|uniref:meprin A subunit beta-like n=1 Tax=Callorhinchus milii TaxID=7868 RepID=UPI001C3F6C67|nr:meprin A subunit beta-like [Callorhinchus milii]
MLFLFSADLGLNLLEGDIKVNKASHRRKVGFGLWPKTIPYYMENNLELGIKGLIMKAFEQYRLKTCIDFKPWAGERNYISFQDSDGCWSFIGNQQRGKQNVSLQLSCNEIGIVEHEILHFLGMIHEQSRDDRDDYITVIWDQIQTDKVHNFNKFSATLMSKLNVPYDYMSVMHYGGTAYSKDNNLTILTKIPEFNMLIGQRMELSDQDVQKVNQLYNCTSSLTFLDSCDFEEPNICSMRETNYNKGNKCNGFGNFMYFDTSTGNIGDRGFLKTRTYLPKRTFQCLQFYYYKNGSEEDQLNVWVKIYDKINRRVNSTNVQTIGGTEFGFWQLHHISLNATRPFRIVFEGVKGSNNSSGGISIDNVNLSETKCPTHMWHITDFNRLLRTSPSGKDGRIFSPKYYSSDGYAFQIVLFVNGTKHIPYHLSVFLFLISGLYDNSLQWPCPWKQVTISLMDQHPDIRHRMSNQRSIIMDPEDVIDTGNQTFARWDRPDKVGTRIKGPDGIEYRIGEGKGSSMYISHQRLRSRDFIKEGNVFFLLTWEDISHLLTYQSKPSPPTPTVPPGSKPNVSVLCVDFECQNGGVCIVANGKPVCRCPAGNGWWFSGKYCNMYGKKEDAIIMAVSSAFTVFILMVVCTLVISLSLKQKYQKEMRKNKQGKIFINVSIYNFIRQIFGVQQHIG